MTYHFRKYVLMLKDHLHLEKVLRAKRYGSFLSQLLQQKSKIKSLLLLLKIKS